MNSTDFNKADLEARLSEFEKQVDAAKEKLTERNSLPAGTHSGHLVKLKDRHKQLKDDIKSCDTSRWEQMKLTWKKDIEGLSHGLERAIEYEEEEFRKGQG